MRFFFSNFLQCIANSNHIYFFKCISCLIYKVMVTTPSLSFLNDPRFHTDCAAQIYIPNRSFYLPPCYITATCRNLLFNCYLYLLAVITISNKTKLERVRLVRLLELPIFVIQKAALPKNIARSCLVSLGVVLLQCTVTCDIVRGCLKVPGGVGGG